MNYDYSKRGYLLPKGCKDLIDVWKIEAQKKALDHQALISAPAPPIIGELSIPEHTTVLRLASLLSQKPFRIVAELIAVGVAAYNINHELDFDTIAKVTRRHGYTAKKAT